MPQTILYYPTIDIQDGNWLRNAILYWDKVASIVPYESYNELSPELNYLRMRGIYTPIYPINLFESKYRADFEKSVIKRLKNYKLKSSKYGIKINKNFNTEKLFSVKMHKNKIYAPNLLELLHNNKLTSNLYNYLLENDFIEEYNGSEWVKISNKFAEIYMYTLAEYLIKISDENIVIGFDQEKYRKQFYPNTWKADRNGCLKISIKECFPLPALNTSIEDLLSFKERYGEDYLVFRNKLLDLEKKLLECKNGLEYKLLIENFKVQWEIELSKNKSLFALNNITWVLGSITSFVGVLGDSDYIGKFITDNRYVAALTLGIGAIELYKEYISYKSKVKQERSSAGYAYLIEAQRQGIIR